MSAPGSSSLFVRQSSGLVRNVSVTNALFFNVAAFVGVGLTLYPIFYSLGFVPVWKFGGISEYAWAAIVAGIFCTILALRPSGPIMRSSTARASSGRLFAIR